MPRPAPSTRRVVFCYHSVHPNRPYDSTKPEVFERHIQWLNEHCRLVSLVDLVSDPQISPNGKPVAAITFDDGYEDNHSRVLPILVRYKFQQRFLSLRVSWSGIQLCSADSNNCWDVERTMSFLSIGHKYVNSAPAGWT